MPAWNLSRTRGSSDVLFALAETSSGSFFWLSSTCGSQHVQKQAFVQPSPWQLSGRLVQAQFTSHSSKISRRCSPASLHFVLYLFPSKIHACGERGCEQSLGEVEN